MPDYDNIALLSLSHRRLDFFLHRSQTNLHAIGLCSLIFQLFCVALSHLGFPSPFLRRKKHETRSWGGIIDRLQNITTRPFSPTAVCGLIFGSILIFIFPLPLFSFCFYCVSFSIREIFGILRASWKKKTRRRNGTKDCNLFYLPMAD